MVFQLARPVHPFGLQKTWNMYFLDQTLGQPDVICWDSLQGHEVLIYGYGILFSGHCYMYLYVYKWILIDIHIFL